MSNGMRIRNDAFSNRVQDFLHSSGYSQKELAAQLNLNPKVLSRKLNGNGNSHLTHLEIRNILLILARWHAITTQDEALHLLEMTEVGPTLFAADEWHTSPLNQLRAKRVYAVADEVSNPNTPIRAFQHNLPAPTTRFIGREWAVERLRYLLGRSDIRLVSLVGLGGCGKTSIALRAAHELVDMFEQGVWFVPLAAMNDPALVPMSIIQALHIKPMPDIPALQSLCTFLRNKHLLLILDNFEHVSEAANVVDEMLAAAPDLKVLVTSRAILHLSSEHALGIPTLDMPDLNVPLEATELTHYEAIQLFVERVQAVLPNFTLTNGNKGIIAHICAKLDGLPLALVLAAPRVRVLPPALLLERLTHARLPMLTGGARNLPTRQQTLRDTIKWSYDLLSSHERAWFPRLGIFSGGWSLEAAEAMAQSSTRDQQGIPTSNSMLDVIEQLVNNSLLVRLPDKGGQPRFTMLETLREYAQEILMTQGEWEQWRDWHACYYLQLAEEAELGLRGPEQLHWLERLGEERDNFRVALEWLLQRAKDGMALHVPDVLAQAMVVEPRRVGGSRVLSSSPGPATGRLALEVCLRLASALRPYWEWQGDVTEAHHWLNEVLAIPLKRCNEKTVLAGRAKALSEMSRIFCLQNEQRRAVELIEESLALWRQLDDPVGSATVLLHRGWVAQALSQNVEAGRIYEEALRLLENTDETWLRAQLLCYVAAAAGFVFDFERMRSFYDRGTALFEQLGDTCALADFLKDQGGMLALDSHYDEAITCLLKSISLCKELDQRQYIMSGMAWLALAIGMRGKPDSTTAALSSAQLKGAVQGLMDAAGITPWTKTHPMIQAINLHIRSQVDEQSWEAAWSAGRTLNLEQAIEMAHRLGEGEV